MTELERLEKRYDEILLEKLEIRNRLIVLRSEQRIAETGLRVGDHFIDPVSGNEAVIMDFVVSEDGVEVKCKTLVEPGVFFGAGAGLVAQRRLLYLKAGGR